MMNCVFRIHLQLKELSVGYKIMVFLSEEKEGKLVWNMLPVLDKKALQVGENVDTISI